ncbi:hypothetical protein AK812_SmicGene14935 [Symbiodinium microadriaticum]|uniref:E3 ubiquitin-protein ligase HERC2 n=1 Tax=Symbiodinium microadriaticum TaxID=2951 RepID=A0A1Q9E4B0_SYMMI|nr:hypothetical protein AK812_SmicGene14935 [Symbiodinium microadriaticum]
MSIAVEVGLLSGKRASVQAGLDETVETLKQRAQVALGVGKGRLLDSSGNVLDVCTPMKKARVQNGDSLTFHIGRVQIQSTGSTFAAILGDGAVVTWGNTGSDSSAVRDQLKNVQQIQATVGGAFAAILADRSVVTWGQPTRGGASAAVQQQLNDVQQIQASFGAFAAILGDGSVVTWGPADFGGDSSAVQDQLKNVQRIQATCGAFAAILLDGSVVTWGAAHCGGDSGAVKDFLRNVQQTWLSKEIAPGYLVIFYQEILHEVPRETLVEDSLRLFVGWRLTESEQSLQDLASQADPGVPDTKALLEAQGVPLLPSGQWPPMYAKSHLLFWKTGLLSWSDRNVRDSCKEWTKVGTQMVRLVPRWFRSLRSLGLPLYAGYTEEEESLMRPAAAWILRNRRFGEHGTFLAHETQEEC